MSCDAKECVLDVLAPVFGDEAGNIAMNYTCFPMSCDVACKQARSLLLRVDAVGREAALRERQEEIDASFEAAFPLREGQEGKEPQSDSGSEVPT